MKKKSLIKGKKSLFNIFGLCNVQENNTMPGATLLQKSADVIKIKMSSTSQAI